MEKRKLINLAISLILTIIAFATNTVKFFIIGILILLASSYVFSGLVTLYSIYLANKYYKELKKNTEYIKEVKQARYKTYFMLSGKELEDEICRYDNHLIKCYDYSKACINFLENLSKYLSKDQYNNVLDAKNEIRETGRE